MSYVPLRCQQLCRMPFFSAVLLPDICLVKGDTALRDNIKTIRMVRLETG